MENQINVDDQNTKQIGQNPVSQPIMTPGKPKINYLLIGGIVLTCFIILSSSVYYLGIKPLEQSQSANKGKNQTEQQVSPPDPVDSWKTYTNTELNYSLKYPNTWNQGGQKLTTEKMIVLTPSSVDQIGYQIQAVYIYAQINSNRLTSLEYYNQNIKPGQEGSVCTNPIINSNIPKPLRNLDITIIEGTCGTLNQGPRTIIAHNGNIIDISSSFVEEIDNNLIYQILSTFKFQDQNSASPDRQSLSLITQNIDIQTPSPVISENQNATLKKTSDNWTGAELFIPYSGDSKLEEKWTAYVNWDYDISFLFPARWRVDLLDDHLTIKRLTGCKGCGGGGFMGIKISYYKNVNNLSLEKLFPYTSWDKQTYVPFSEETYEYKVKNTNITVYLERSTPGPGPGQTAFISNNKVNTAVQLYCGDCNDSEMNNIVSTFDFEVERHSVESFFNKP